MKLNITFFISLLCLSAYAFVCSVHAQVEHSHEGKLNVLFIVSDDLRPELGCYGNELIHSPNIDRLASRGLVFGHAYCQQAVCSPSRSSVMTGMRPDSTKVYNLSTHFRDALPDVVTLPQLFKSNGYRTQSLGKIYHSRQLDDEPSWTVSSHRPESEFEMSRTVFTSHGFCRQEDDGFDPELPLTDTDRGPPFRISEGPVNGGSDGEIADAAIAALQQFSEESMPFFLAVGFKKPHLPFVVAEHYWELYDPDDIPFAPNRFLPGGAPEFALVEKNELWNYSSVPDTPDLPDEYARQLKHGYYASISYMDAQLGRVMDELNRLELTENTIVVLWGDHGWKLGEHNRWCKHSNFEEDTRAPLIICAPGMRSSGQTTDAVVEFVDIYPTIAELAGLVAPAEIQGRSLVPLLDDHQRSWDEVAMSQYPRRVDGQKLMGYSMRTERYRLTRWVAEQDQSELVALELYDHESDPQENINIAHDPESAALVVELADRWRRKLHSCTSTLNRPESASVANSIVHPGVAHSIEDIQFVKDMIAAGEQPWLDVWEQLKRNRFASLSYGPNPHSHVERGPYNNPDIGSSEFSNDSWAAYVHALIWAIGGDEDHANKSVEILDAWSGELQSISNHDAKLLIGMSGYRFCIAAELLKHTSNHWSVDGQVAFEEMLREIWFRSLRIFFRPQTATGMPRLCRR
ncbi:MAG: sulfatase [Planctomycetota bacterium]